MKDFPWGSPETQFFFALTPDKILDAVETFGFRCSGRVLALNSMENRVYEVELETDTPSRSNPENYKIIKFYRPGRWSKDQIGDEHQYLLDLAEVEIPVVCPLKDEAGQTIRKLDDCDIFYSVFPKVGGRAPDELTDEQLAIVGRLLGRMHNVGAAKTADHRIKLNLDSLGRANLEFLMGKNTIPQPFDQSFKTIAEQIFQFAEPLFQDCEMIRIHGDCHLGNLIWGGHGPFWVDFDDMMMGPPIQDLWLLFQSRGDTATEKWRRVIASYETMRPFDRRSLQMVEALRALRFIHFSAWIAGRWQDPAFPRNFPNFGTDKYWQDAIADLREQLALLQSQTYIRI